MPDIRFLKEQMERARRLADALTSTADRDQLRATADDFQRQINAATAQPEMQQSMSHDQGTDETGTKSPGAEPEMG